MSERRCPAPVPEGAVTARGPPPMPPYHRAPTPIEGHDVARRTRSIALLVATLTLLAVASPAWADPPGPTDYRARVLTIEPDDDDIRAEVHGGDSYLLVEVAAGVSATVPGYDDEEIYLRFDADGRVYENQASATYFQNQDRYGAPIPPTAGPDAEPRWVQVSDNGTFAWHDHRIHWMSPTPPPQIDTAAAQAQPVYDWEVPLTVDGEPHLIAGDLTWYPPPSSVPALLAFVVAAVVGILLAGKRVAGAAGVAIGAGALALLVVVGGRLGLPTGIQAEAALLPPALIAVVAPAAALAAKGRPVGERLALAGLGALAAAVCVLLQTPAFTRPIVPNALPDLVVRTALAAVVGLALATLVAVARRLGPELGTAPDATGADAGVS